MIGIEHNTAAITKKLTQYCENQIKEKGYFTAGYEIEIERHIAHSAEFIRHNDNDSDFVYHTVKALDKLLFEINKVYISDNFDSEFASSSWSGC